MNKNKQTNKHTYTQAYTFQITEIKKILKYLGYKQNKGGLSIEKQRQKIHLTSQKLFKEEGSGVK